MPVGERYFDAPTVFRRHAPTVFRRSHTDTYHLRKHVRENIDGWAKYSRLRG